MAEYRILANTDRRYAHANRVHLAEYVGSDHQGKSLCGRVFTDGSPFDEWQLLDDCHGPEGCDSDCRHGCELEDKRCAHCWISFDSARHKRREREGRHAGPRTYTRKRSGTNRGTPAGLGKVSFTSIEDAMNKRAESALQVSREAEAKWQAHEAERAKLLRERIAAHRQAVKAGVKKTDLANEVGMTKQALRYLVDTRG